MEHDAVKDITRTRLPPLVKEGGTLNKIPKYSLFNLSYSIRFIIINDLLRIKEYSKINNK